MTSFGSECLWHDKEQPGLAQDPLPSQADLAVVGAGFLGLNTALHAARRGMKVVVFDAGPLGGGASGVNGGQVIPGLKHDPSALIAMLGQERGEALAAFAAGTADAVFNLIRNERLSVPHHRTGWILAAHTEAAYRTVQSRAEALRKTGAAVDILDRNAVQALTGARGYHGGLIDRRAGAIQPFAYLSELVRLAASAGVVLRSRCCVTAVEGDADGWSVTTSVGDLKAGKVLVATNADADALIPGLARTVLPLHSFQIATAPLRPEVAHALLPGGQAVSDTRRIVTYYRKSADCRLVLGGRGTLGVPRHAADWHHLERAALRLFPHLEALPITHRWFGRVAITLDYLPHIHEPAPGLVAVLGCQGRGIGLMTALGGRLASYLDAGDADALPLPITPIRPIPFHRFRHLGVTAALAWYRMLDGLQR